ncbi:MAG: hypothetical protein FJ125_00600 [Deltaproteobacteria bacterium]|nr:hypothetical protein [Deltaproteobacteria bacterium]
MPTSGTGRARPGRGRTGAGLDAAPALAALVFTALATLAALAAGAVAGWPRLAAAQPGLFPAEPTSLPPSPTPPAPRGYSDFSRAGAGFWGPGRESAPERLPPTVKVGLFGPGQGEEAVELQRGAGLALEEANRQGGAAGRPFELVWRADDGAWGKATPRLVELAYAEQVWAIVGGLDGHHAHLAELVAAKLWVPVVTPWAADRTIDYANVPWVFRCPPDDARQAEALLRHAAACGALPLLLLREEEREARVAGERLAEAARRLGLPQPEQRVFTASADVAATVAAARAWATAAAPATPAAALPAGSSPAASPPARAILIWGRRQPALRLAEMLRRGGYTGLLLAPAALAVPEAAAIDGLVVAAPFDLSRPSPAWTQLDQLYGARFGEAPSALAVMAHEAMALTLGAIAEAGLNRARIRDALARTVREGAAGSIRFDGLGGNPAWPVLVRASAGRWLPPGEQPGAAKGCGGAR